MVIINVYDNQIELVDLTIKSGIGYIIGPIDA